MKRCHGGKLLHRLQASNETRMTLLSEAGAPPTDYAGDINSHHSDSSCDNPDVQGQTLEHQRITLSSMTKSRGALSDPLDGNLISHQTSAGCRY